MLYILMVHQRRAHADRSLAYIGADFLGAMGANAPRENISEGASHPQEFGRKIPIKT